MPKLEDGLIKFLPSYVGSKAMWVKELQEFRGKDFVEPFCGSAVLSANLAGSTIINDLDDYVYKILRKFDELIVPEVFTQADYLKYRSQSDWWKYIYCLQKMSFSGVFRYSDKGYNVPVKPEVKEVRLREEYEAALARWKSLKPTVTHTSYIQLVDKLKGKVVVLDPPYEGSKASYNSYFQYGQYWEYVEQVKSLAETVIIFDSAGNLESHGVKVFDTRKMRVNGGQAGDVEGVGIYQHGKWRIHGKK